MEANRRALLEYLLKQSQKHLLSSLEDILKKNYDNVIATKDYIIAQGNIPVALVAHLDTVWQKTKYKNVFFDPEAEVMWSPQGLGADDRAGVYAILAIVAKGLRPTVIFTTDEEIGGVGAEALTTDYFVSPWEINYIIELDRQGEDDCVFYNCANNEFEDYIQQFGFTTDFGSFSDISIICPRWGIAGVNVSVGYLYEHSYSELLHLPWLEKTIQKITKILETANHPLFPYIAKSNYNWSLHDGMSACKSCGRWEDSYLMLTVDGANYCPRCSAEKIDWCHTCGNPYVIGTKHQCKEVKANGNGKADPGAIQ